jgi:hypothetical protein
MDTNEVSTLERRLADLDRALFLNEERLAREPAPPSRDGRRTYRRQELESERRDLRTERGKCDQRLREAQSEIKRNFRLFMPHREVTPSVERARASFEKLVAEARDGLEASADREERAGSHRQARLLRAQAADAAAMVAREYPVLAEDAGFQVLVPR